MAEEPTGTLVLLLVKMTKSTALALREDIPSTVRLLSFV